MYTRAFIPIAAALPGPGTPRPGLRQQRSRREAPRRGGHRPPTLRTSYNRRDTSAPAVPDPRRPHRALTPRLSPAAPGGGAHPAAPLRCCRRGPSRPRGCSGPPSVPQSLSPSLGSGGRAGGTSGAGPGPEGSGAGQGWAGRWQRGRGRAL